MPMDQVTFNATLEDNVTPNLQKLEKQLREMGQTPAQIRMTLNAVDQATPKIQEAQKQVNALPKEHTISLKVAADNIREELAKVKEEVTRPFKIPFSFVDKDNGSTISQSLTSQLAQATSTVANQVALPVANQLPGANMALGLGGAAGVAGIVSAIGDATKQSVAINASMEQQHQMLAQSLKDSAGATTEMNKIISYSFKTPYQLQSLISADVIGRSYGMPTMAGENKQLPQGYLQLATNMAAMMQTDPSNAMQALAEARQGMPRRMLMYGVNLEQSQFSPGGRFAGKSMDQALELVSKRFDGAATAQMKTFSGIESNIKDVLQQQIIKPIGSQVFSQIEQNAFGMAGGLGTDATTKKIGELVEKVQHATVTIMQDLSKVRDYFDEHLKQPIEDVISALVQLGKTFATAFGGTSLIAVSTLANAVSTIAEPIASIVKSVPLLGTMMGYMKAMQMMHMGGAVSPIQNILHGVTGHPIDFMKGVAGLPMMGAKIGGFLVVKDLVDAHKSAEDLNDMFSNMHGNMDMVNASVAKMAAGLGVSETSMRNLVTAAGQGIPTGRMSAANRVTLAERTADAGQQISNITGMGSSDVIKALTDQMKESSNYTTNGMHQFGSELIQLSAVAKTFKTDWSNASRIMSEFAPQAAPVGLGGLGGASALLGLSQGFNNYGVTSSQITSGLYTPDAVMQQALSAYRTPTASDLDAIVGKNKNWSKLGQYWNFKSNPAAFQRYGGPDSNISEYNKEATGDLNSQTKLRDWIAKYAPTSLAGIPSVPEPWIKGQPLGLSAFQAKQVGYGRTTVSPGLGYNPMSFEKGSADPAKQAEQAGMAWSKAAQDVSRAQMAYGALQATISKLQSQLTSLQQAQSVVDLQMQAYQQKITMANRAVEDSQLAIQEYTLNALTPLEHELDRVSNAMDVVSHSMQNAQYNMGKFADGLVTGEQAALNNLHALSLYNEQLQYLQNQYTGIGQELGTQVYERGYSARVAPLEGLSLQMQMQRLQRRQQLAQEKYDITYGEDHYKMQQAQRTRFQRTEMPLSERLKGIRENQTIIDNSTVTTQKLQNQQFDLQERIFHVNQNLQKQTDALTALQIGVSKLQQSPEMRKLQDEQYKLGQKVGYANVAITQQQSIASKWQNYLANLRQQAQDLQGLFTSLLTFPTTMSGRFDTARKIVHEGMAAGNIGKAQGAEVLATLNQAQKAAEVAKKNTAGQWYHDRGSWIDIIKQGIWGIFSGDTWRKIGDLVGGVPGVGGILSTGMHLAGDAAPIATTVGATLVAMGTSTWALKGIASKVLTAMTGDSTLVKLFTGAAGSTADALLKVGPKLPGILGKATTAAGEAVSPWRESSKVVDMALDRQSLFKTIAGKFDPLVHPIKFFKENTFKGVGTALGYAFSGGHPVGGFAGGKLGEMMAKYFGKGEKAAEIDKAAAEAQKVASTTSADAAAKTATAAADDVKKSGILGKAASKFRDVVSGSDGFWGAIKDFMSDDKGVGKFGKIIGAFGAAIAIFKGAITGIGDLLKNVFHIGGNKASGIDEAAREAAKAAQKTGGEASKAADDAAAGAKKAKSLLEKAGETTGASIKTLASKGGDAFESATAKAASAVESHSGKAADLLRSAGSTVNSVLTSGGTKAGEKIAAAGANMSRAVGGTAKALGGTIRALGHVATVLGAVFTIKDFAQGNIKGGVNTGSYFTPYLGPARIMSDITGWATGFNPLDKIAGPNGIFNPGGLFGGSLPNYHAAERNYLLGSKYFDPNTSAGRMGLVRKAAGNLDSWAANKNIATLPYGVSGLSVPSGDRGLLNTTQNASGDYLMYYKMAGQALQSKNVKEFISDYAHAVQEEKTFHNGMLQLTADQKKFQETLTGNQYAKQVNELTSYLSKVKDTNSKAYKEAYGELQKAKANEIQFQNQWQKLNLQQTQQYWALNQQQQDQAQIAATTGPTGLTTYLADVAGHIQNHWTQRIAYVQAGLQSENTTTNAGFQAITQTTSSWLGAIAKTIQTWSKSMGLGLAGKTSVGDAVGAAVQGTMGAFNSVSSAVSTAFQGFEGGGVVKADPHKHKLGSGRMVRMVEEGHPEMVIPLAPHRREHARELVKQAHGMVGGYAGGGMVAAGKMAALLDYAKTHSVYGEDGRCLTHVEGFMTAVGYPGGTHGIGHPYAWDFGVDAKANAGAWGLQVLASGDPYKAPPGGVVVVPHPNPGTAMAGPNPGEAGDIAVADGRGGFFNGGSNSYGGPGAVNNAILLVPAGYSGEAISQIATAATKGRNALAKGGKSAGAGLKLAGIPAILEGMGIMGQMEFEILKREKSTWLAELMKKAKSSVSASGGKFSTQALGNPKDVSSRFSSNQKVFMSTLASLLGQAPRTIGAWMAAEEPPGASSGYGGTQDWLNVGITDSGPLGQGNAVWKNPASAARATAAWMKGSWNDPGFGIAAGSIQALTKIGNNPNAFFSALASSGWASSGYGGAGNLMSLYNQGYAGGWPNVSRDATVDVHQGEMIVPAAVAHAARAHAGKGMHHGHKKHKLSEDDGFIKIQDKIFKTQASISNIESDIHKTRKLLEDAKSKADKQKDQSALDNLEKALLAHNAVMEKQQTAYTRAIGRGLVVAGDTSGGENTTAGVTKETSTYTNTITKDTTTKSITKEESTISKLEKELQKLETIKHPTKAQKALIAKIEGEIKIDKAQLAKLEKAAKQKARDSYVIGAAKRGVNAGLIKEITGKGLTKAQAIDYKKLAQAVAKEKRHPDKANEKAVQKAEKTLKKALDDGTKKSVKAANDAKKSADKGSAATKAAAKNADKHAADAKKASDTLKKGADKNAKDTHKAITDAQKKAATDAAKIQKSTTDVHKSITDVQKAADKNATKAAKDAKDIQTNAKKDIDTLHSGLTKTMSDANKQQLDAHKATQKSVEDAHKAISDAATKAQKAASDSNTYQNKHETHMSKTETHQAKVETHNQKMEDFMQKLIAKDTNVYITATAPVTTNPPARARSK